MVRVPSCEKLGLKKGPWTPEEDHKLSTFIQSHGHCSWRALPKQAGLQRCGKSCRLRWTNYLRPGIKRGSFSLQEENNIIQLHAALGNRWSTIATHLPGRTDNEIKNHWNTRLRKRLLKMGIDPTTHRPCPQQQQHLPSSINTLLLSLLQGAAPFSADANSSLLNALLLGSSCNSLSHTCNGLFPASPGHVVQNNIGSAPAAAIPPPAVLDPAVLAAAETRRWLDFLKFNNAENQSTSCTSDHQLNDLLTRLLLIKLLQGSTNHAASQRSDSVPANHLLQTPGLHPVGNTVLLPAAAQPVQPYAYANPNLGAALNDNNYNSIPTAKLLNMLRSSYEQRLPLLAESVIEPCTSGAATDNLSSTSPHQLSQTSLFNCAQELTTPNGSSTSPRQLSQASFFNCANELVTPNESLTRQQSSLWSAGHAAAGRENAVLPNGVMQKQSLPGVSQLMTSAEQLLAGAGMSNIENQVVSGPQTLMTWEEHLMREQKGDFVSSSTVSSRDSSTSQQSHAAPNTPTHNFDMLHYWSDLLNLISSTK